MVKDEQVRLLRKKMTEGKTQETAAADADMSVRSARKWQRGPLPSATRKRRDWRTRPDPFAEHWATDVVPLLEQDKEGALEAKTLLDVLKERYPKTYRDDQLRTLQRRVRHWRALRGPEKEVYFPQEHVPGREAQIDFTNCNCLGVTIAGRPFEHLLFEFVLVFSGWTWVCLALGETFEALLAGAQGAVWQLGGVPQVWRSDNLSAATHELRMCGVQQDASAPGSGERRAGSGRRVLNARYRAVLEHYGAQSTRIEPGESHQNGAVEKTHDLTKKAVEQALLLRGSRDFESEEQYLAFVRGVVERARNTGIEHALEEERRALLPLPSAPLPSYTTFHATVRCWSTIHFGKRTYSVPSRLIGHTVEVRQHADEIEVRCGQDVVATIPRARGRTQHHVDYRHVIWSLVKKPGAFARYRYREDLFPSLTFRRAYDSLRQRRGERADVEYVRILHLAASTMEATVERALADLLEAGAAFDYAAVKALAQPARPAVPAIAIGAPNLGAYDELLGGAR